MNYLNHSHQTNIKKLILYFLIPFPFIMLICFFLGKASLDQELDKLANSYMIRLNKMANELRDENKQALYEATSCDQIKRDILFEDYLREMIIVDNANVVCSSISQRKLSNLNQFLNLETKDHPTRSIQFVDFPYQGEIVRSLVVIDFDENNPKRYAASVIDKSYINVQLGSNADDRIDFIQLKIGDVIYPNNILADNHNPSTYLESDPPNKMAILLSASDKFKLEQYRFYFLLGLPLSLLTSLFTYLLSFWFNHKNSLYEDLKKAIKNKELYLVYQPLIENSSKQLYGVEALLRWESKHHGLIPPDIFIPLAEQNGLINAITDYVFEQALEDWKKINHQNPLHLSLNIPPQYLRKKGMLGKVVFFANEYKEQNLNLALEITERQPIDEESNAILGQVRQHGIEIYIDDFGTGYTSLSKLQDIEFDCLKIDRCFINNIGVDSITSPVLDSIINLAERLDVYMVAEGIETQEQLNYLTERNIDYMQGYFFYKPMLLKDLCIEFASEMVYKKSTL